MLKCNKKSTQNLHISYTDIHPYYQKHTPPPQKKKEKKSINDHYNYTMELKGLNNMVL
jgi:hypothetical protein